MRHGTLQWIALAPVLALALLAGPARAGITLEIDDQALAGLLAELTTQSVPVTLPSGDRMEVTVRNLSIVEFLPGRGAAGGLRTAVTVAAPAFGLEMRLTPLLRFAVDRAAEAPALLIRFEDIRLNLGITTIDLGGALPPLRYPAEQLFQMDAAEGQVQLRVRLKDLEVQRDRIRFFMDLDSLP